MIQYCVSELTITDRSGVVEHSHPPITEYMPGKQKKRKKTLYQKNGKIVSTTDNYHYYLTIILEI